jgi:hypothetical protein
MHKRFQYLLLAAILLLPNSGCAFLYGLKCCMNRFHCAIAQRTYCCDSCGEKYCCEWCSDPPACCEPCDNCGNFQACNKSRWVGPKRGYPESNFRTEPVLAQPVEYGEMTD